MSTTTIRLPEELKARIDKLAASSGKSTHAFMVEALGQSAELAERQQAFEAEVNKRWARLRRTRQAHTLEDLRDYGLALTAGERRPRPKTHKLDLPPRKAGAAWRDSCWPPSWPRTSSASWRTCRHTTPRTSTSGSPKSSTRWRYCAITR